MNLQSAPQCTGLMTNIVLEGVEEIIGRDVLPKTDTAGSGPVESVYMPVSGFDVCLSEQWAAAQYGERGAQGVAFRCGEASFRCFIRKQGADYGLTSLSFRLMNSRQRLPFGLQQLAAFAAKNCGVKIDLVDTDTHWLWQVHSTPSVTQWNELRSAYTQGLLREYLGWASGGRFFVFDRMPANPENGVIYQLSILKQPLGN